MKPQNAHTTRESWLRAATDEIRPYFEKLGYRLPDKIRFAIAFTSTGKRGRIPIECWYPESSADQHFEIIIRADISEPLDALNRLVPVLVHTLLPSSVRYGKEYKAIAVRIGLEGPMRHATATPILKERLQAIANNLGPFPHAMLNFGSVSNAEKKQPARMLKAECSKTCGYTIRLSEKWARAGLPVCPVNAKHGALKCNLPNDGDEITDAENEESELIV